MAGGWSLNNLHCYHMLLTCSVILSWGHLQLQNCDPVDRCCSGLQHQEGQDQGPQ